MDEQITRSAPDVQDDETPTEAAGMGRTLPRIIFAIVSIGFLTYLGIGTVEARIWRFGRLYFEDRAIRDVWGYLGDHLPNLPGQTLITGVYWASLLVMVAGVIGGLWLFLGTDDDDPARDVTAVLPEQSTLDA